MTVHHFIVGDTKSDFVEQEKCSSRILIITSCTKDKHVPPEIVSEQPGSSELWDSCVDSRVARNYGHLEPYRVSASKLYRGRQHLEVMQGVELLRKAFGRSIVDMKIISAGFGLVDEDELIPPYNVTFAGLSATKVFPIAKRLGIPQALQHLLAQDYDCAFFLLGEEYLSSLGLPFAIEPKFPCVFLASQSLQAKVPDRFPYIHVCVGQPEATSFGSALISLKGLLFKHFAHQIVQPSPLFAPDGFGSEESYERMLHFLLHPSSDAFFDLVRPYRKKEQVAIVRKPTALKRKSEQMSFEVITKKNLQQAKNYGRPMRYYIPDWDDLVDPAYDFAFDKGNPQKQRYDDEVYAHQIYSEPNYDGLLFSKSTIEQSQTKIARIKKGGIHAFARFLDKPIFGDCGAFSYVDEEVPPYHTPEILEYYQSLGFDYGVSIDHLIFAGMPPEVKSSRYNLTRRNAAEFIEAHRAGSYTFTPVGVAQGWSPETYRDSVAELLDMGYQYIALGGLARSQSKEIFAIMELITPLLREDTDIHLFGVARIRDGKEMQQFREMGVTSFDSASFLRKAWLGTTNNYHMLDGQKYTAFRIPPINPASSRVKKLLATGSMTFDQLKQLEKEALHAIRAYDRGQLDLETTLDTLLAFERIGDTALDKHQALYRKTLEDQPWKQCPCTICREIGVEVAIFRGNDRNRRRGFHNTYVFYQRFQELMRAYSSSLQV